MTEDAVPRPGLRGYLSSAANLRVTIERNILDYVFEASGGRIVYIFDASVVQLFLDPTGQTRHLRTFGRPEMPDEARTTAIITAEFLFSRNLSGQRGSPAYLSSSHAEDVANVMGQVGLHVDQHRAGEKARERLAPDIDVKRQAKEVLEDVRRGAMPGPEAIRRLAVLVPELASAVFLGPASEARQFRRLMDEDLIRPLQLLPEATRSVLEPDPRRVAAWARLLEEERALSRQREVETGRARHARASPADTRGRRLRLGRDAETLTQLLLLNEGASDHAVPTRYVMVTTDRLMSRAYARWHYNERRGDFASYAVRHPSQYLPILNMQQMSDGSLRSELVEQVRDAIDSLFEVLQEDGGNYLRSLISVADPALAHDGPSALSVFDLDFLSRMAVRGSARGAVEDARSKWSEASRGALLLNGRLLARHFDHGWTDAATILENAAGMQDGVLDYLDSLMQTLEAAHASFAIHGLLQIQRKRSFEEQRPSREPLLVRAPGVVPQEMLFANTTARLIEVARSAGLGFSTNTPVGRRHDYRALLFAACVAFRVRQRHAAYRFCRRAVAMLMGVLAREGEGHGHGSLEDEKFELYYVEAATTRFRIGEQDNYTRIRARLNDSLAFYRGKHDVFGISRTHCELATLGLAVVRARRSDRSAPSNDAPDLLQAFLDALDAVSEARAAMPATKDRNNDPFDIALRDQVILLSTSAYLYDHLVFKTGSFKADHVREFLRAAERQLRPRWALLSPFNLVEHQALWFSVTTGEDADQRRPRVLEALAKMSPVPADEVDALLVEHIRDNVALQ